MTISERDLKIVAMRQANKSVGEISQVFKLTRARIGSILAKAESLGIATGLTGIRATRISARKPCPVCGNPIKINQNTCSRTCQKAMNSESRKEQVELVISLRRQGKTWTETAKEMGWNAGRSGTSLCSWAKGACKSLGMDPSQMTDVFTSTGRKK